MEKGSDESLLGAHHHAHAAHAHLHHHAVDGVETHRDPAPFLQDVCIIDPPRPTVKQGGADS